MSETLENNSSEQGQSDWDALTKLSMGSSAEQAPQGASYVFQQEAMAHRNNAEAFFSQASQDQKDQLKTVGIRDSQDAGEYLHEMDSWNRQIERRVETIDGNIETAERMLAEQGEHNGVNPITGERLEDSPSAPIERRREENFQRRQEELISPNTVETKAVSAMIRGELQIQDSNEPQEAIAPRSAEALEKESIDKWIATVSNDADKNKKLHDSVFYATLKRKIQREAEERAKAESTAA